MAIYIASKVINWRSKLLGGHESESTMEAVKRLCEASIRRSNRTDLTVSAVRFTRLAQLSRLVILMG